MRKLFLKLGKGFMSGPKTENSITTLENGIESCETFQVSSRNYFNKLRLEVIYYAILRNTIFGLRIIAEIFNSYCFVAEKPGFEKLTLMSESPKIFLVMS